VQVRTTSQNLISPVSGNLVKLNILIGIFGHPKDVVILIFELKMNSWPLLRARHARMRVRARGSSEFSSLTTRGSRTRLGATL